HTHNIMHTHTHAHIHTHTHTHTQHTHTHTNLVCMYRYSTCPLSYTVIYSFIPLPSLSPFLPSLLSLSSGCMWYMYIDTEAHYNSLSPVAVCGICVSTQRHTTTLSLRICVSTQRHTRTLTLRICISTQRHTTTHSLRICISTQRHTTTLTLR